MYPSLGSAKINVNNCFLPVVPTLKHYSDIVSDIPSESVYGLSMLTFDLTFFLAYILTFFLTFYISDIYSEILSGNYSDVLSGILSGISLEIFCG